MSRVSDYALMGLAVMVGGGSLVWFGGSLVVGLGGFVRFGWSEPQCLQWDALLSVAFFFQHSGMVRDGFRKWLDRAVDRRRHAAVYAISSGLVLGTVLLLWQPSATMLWSTPVPWRWGARFIFVMAAAGLAWGGISLRSLDAFGLTPIRAGRDGKPAAAPRLTIGGPYRWVRHPLYSAMLVLLWATPDATADRLLFNLLWSGWILISVRWEERDLVAAHGDSYLRYRQEVPMFLPWRGRVGGAPN